MIEKVNPCHPDKIADRIAGAIVDLAYSKVEKGHPKVACEVLIGHGICHIINETSEHFTLSEIEPIVRRIAGDVEVDYKEYKQDEHLAQNQNDGVRCGDNGIFRGVCPNKEDEKLSRIARTFYWKYKSDGKCVLDNDKLIICQSNANKDEIKELYPKAIINPIGDWTGGTDVDTGATNRKLGSDMGASVTGGGLHGKDLTKADVSINVYLHKLAIEYRALFECSCAIGDDTVNIRRIYDGTLIKTITPHETKAFADIVAEAREYIETLGGFEKLAEWGLF